MTTTTAPQIPDQPDGINEHSRDLPDPHRAAERVGEFIAAWGDGLMATADGHPLYARDLEALRRAATTVAGLRSMVAELTAENARLLMQLADGGTTHGLRATFTLDELRQLHDDAVEECGVTNRDPWLRLVDLLFAAAYPRDVHHCTGGCPTTTPDVHLPADTTA